MFFSLFLCRCFFLIYYTTGAGYRNLLILFASLLFYYIGDSAGIVVLLFSIALNFFTGQLIASCKAREQAAPGGGAYSRYVLIAGVIVNLGLLAYFKYIVFLTGGFVSALSVIGIQAHITTGKIALPLGISFFAFQGISYLMDVYRGDIQPSSKLLAFATYKSMFPQLIAGPIVRYADVSKDLYGRRITSDDVLSGIERFCRGLAKKVIIADTMAQIVDAIFALPANEMGFEEAWLGAIAYTIQIYFDFSGYSDMAIGMGRMMGFTYPENFNHPYTAVSIRDFWRRWHMTLSSWFRDYVYVSLGGNRRGAARTYLNLFVIFFLTGLWHGASWTFVIWGLWHGLFMILERRFDPSAWPIPSAFRRFYMLLVVIVGWVLFRASSFDQAGLFLSHMFLLRGDGPVSLGAAAFMNYETDAILVLAIFLSAPLYTWAQLRVPPVLRLPTGSVVAASLTLVSSLKVLSGAYSPFLYFRF
jgi:alginate O-acetyltransferase complex protein AlgI